MLKNVHARGPLMFYIDVFLCLSTRSPGGICVGDMIYHLVQIFLFQTGSIAAMDDEECNHFPSHAILAKKKCNRSH